MLTRRHIRTKVMQSLYAMAHEKQPDLQAQQKFLNTSLLQMTDLYMLLLQLWVEVKNHYNARLQINKQKHFATEADRNPSLNFTNNKVIALIASCKQFQEKVKDNKINSWQENEEYINLLTKAIIETSAFQDYLSIDKPDFEADRKIIITLFKECIAPHEKLHEYIEDKSLTWVDDFPLVNTALVKALGKINQGNAINLLVPPHFKSEDDILFAKKLLQKTFLNSEALTSEIDGKTPNWDKERIADLDLIILQMGIAEFLHFPSIPIRVTINEYLEIAKEYSTPKSSLFINGILDKLVKEYEEQGRLQKIGRGLM